jgi:hypothetical protein
VSASRSPRMTRNYIPAILQVRDGTCHLHDEKKEKKARLLCAAVGRLSPAAENKKTALESMTLQRS